MIVIARVHAGLVDARFWQSYEQLIKPVRADGSPDWLPAVVERLHVDRARNEIVDMVLHPEKPRMPLYPKGVDMRYREASHILFIDDDMVVPPNGLIRLLSHDLPIVGGLYFGRQPPHLPVAYRHVEGNQWIPVTKFGPGLQEVDAIGFGFMLVKREVFERMQEPWFEFSHRMGEDMYFCQQAKELGYDIVLDADVLCHHLATVEIGLPHYEAYQSQGFTFQEHEANLRALSEEIRPYKPKKTAFLNLIPGATEKTHANPVRNQPIVAPGGRRDEKMRLVRPTNGSTASVSGPDGRSDADFSR